MDIRLRERLERDAERTRTGSQQAPGRLCRLLHHVAELAGEGDLSLAGHPDRFDEHDVTAHRRPRQSGRHADLRRPTSLCTLGCPAYFSRFFDDTLTIVDFPSTTSRAAFRSTP